MNACPNCKARLAPGARFCSACGAPTGGPMPAAQPGPNAPYVPRIAPKPGMSPGAKWGIVAGVSLVVAAVAFWLGANGYLGLYGQKDKPVLQATAQPAPAVMQRTTQPAPPVMQQTQRPPVKIEMPADVRAWLEHLERIERQRVAISKEQLGAMLVEMTMMQGAGVAEAMKSLANPDPDAPEPTPPARRFAGRINNLKQNWNQLISDFGSLPPPQECVPIRNDYDQALRETGGMMFDIMEAIDLASTDPTAAVQKLTSMQGTSGQRIDTAAVATDKGVQAVCDRYETRKWFSITGDVGGGMMGKIGGF